MGSRRTRPDRQAARRDVAPRLATLGRAGDAGATAHYADAAYYRKAYGDRRQDVDFYARAARNAGGAVLEYGIGNGRVAIAMARAGAEVVGVDLSQPMLRDLEEQLAREPRHIRERVTWVQGDMRTVRLGRRFALVIAPFNTVLHLYQRPEIEAFLAGVREHLTPDGRFVFDFSVPQAADLGRDPERVYRAPRLRYPTTGRLVRYGERFEYDPVRQILLVKMEFTPEDGDPWVVPLTHRQFFPAEMEALLHYNGFAEITFFADFSGQEPDASVDSLVVSCRLAPRRRVRWGSPARGPDLRKGRRRVRRGLARRGAKP